MILSSLSVFHYRNIDELSFNCNESINCLIGKNGVGKTNVLDAIYYLSFCKSNVLANDAMNIKHGESSFIIQGAYNIDDSQVKVSCAYEQANKQKTVKCNDKKYTRFSDHIGLIPIVFISPNDILLINEGGLERRKFLDAFISMYNQEYFSNLLTYNKLLQQRNSLLKQEQAIDETYLSILDEKLSILGLAIYEERKKAVQELSLRTQKFYGEISTSEECSISYISQLHQGNMKGMLFKSIERDKYLTYTSVGIHRDDLQFYFKENPIKNVASQGQRKSFLLALKFAQYQLITEFKNGQKPILLLDDLFDNLDQDRAKNIFDMIDSQNFGQIFITETDKIMLQAVFEQRKGNGAFWQVTNGGVIQKM